MGEEALFHAMVAPPVTMASLQPWNPVTLAFQVRTATLSGRTFFLPAFFCVTRPGVELSQVAQLMHAARWRPARRESPQYP